MLASLAPSTLEATTIHVPQDQPTIQAGIYAASSGDTVIVECGTYFEHNINLQHRDIYLTSSSGSPDCVTIDAERQGRVIYCAFVDSTAALVGFTLTRGIRAGEVGDTSIGAGMRCAAASPRIEHCVFRDNEANREGGGVYCSSGAPTFRDVTFEGNIALGGGGLHCEGDNALPKLYDVVFSGNHAYNSGGGMNASRHAAPTLTRVSFLGNTSGGSGHYGCGAGARFEDTDAVFTDVVFDGNVSDYSAGALQIGGYGSPVLERCVFVGNSAADRGGAIGMIGPCTGVEFRNCTLSRNEAPLGSALHADSNPLLLRAEFVNSIITFGLDGEAVIVDGPECAATFTCCDIFGNAGGDWTGTIADQLGVDGNISLDPLFCGDAVPEQPLSLSAASPCAAEYNPECGQIGTFGVECWFTPVHETSWGAIKALYGDSVGRQPN
jgi:hypothetical protein